MEHRLESPSRSPVILAVAARIPFDQPEQCVRTSPEYESRVARRARSCIHRREPRVRAPPAQHHVGNACRVSSRTSRSRIVVEERDRAIVQRVLAVVVVACLVPLCGCAIRYDHAGVTRVGIGLWGFGDPPGVNWNLDWPPRREVPELPPMGPRDTPQLPRASLAPIDDVPAASMHATDAGRDVAIDDNRCRADHSDALAHFAPLSQRADPRGSPAPRR